MAHPYLAFDPEAMVNGEVLEAVNLAFHLPQHARRLLAKHGLPPEPSRNEWYSLQGWLNLLAELETAYGGQTVYAVGLQIMAGTAWPSDIVTLEQALKTLDNACRATVDSKPMGYYRAQQVTPRVIRVACYTPTPPDFERGLLMGVARKFKPADSLRIWVEPEETPADSPALLKWFRVTWT